MRTHVVKTASSCFAVLRQIWIVRRSVSLVLTKLNYGCITLAGLLANLLDRLQLVLNAVEQLIYGQWKYDHVTPLLRELHWLRVPERITFRLATLAYRCQHNMAPHYLAVQLHQASSVTFRQQLCSVSTSELIVPRTVHSTIGDRVFWPHAVLWVTYSFSTSPEDWTVLMLLPRLTTLCLRKNVTLFIFVIT